MFAARTQHSKEKCSFKSTIYNELPVIEIIVYYIGWISGILYMLYSVYIASQDNQDINELLVDGWPFTQLKRDATDYMYEMMYITNLYMIFYAILHYLVAEFLKHFYIKALPYFYCLFSLGLVTFYTSHKIGFILIVQAFLSYLVAYFGNKFYIWIYGVMAIATVYFPHHNLQRWCNLTDSELPILLSAIVWNNLRYLSFALDINTKQISRNFIHFLGYYLYFPTLLHGPLLIYEDFQTVYKLQNANNFKNNFLKYIRSMIKYTIYFYITMLLLHFLHYGLVFQLENVNVSYAASHGFFWWAAFLFMLKHQILYGLTTSAAKAEGIRATNPPKCIGRIALYSEMWKTFDQSMYWFKKRYIFHAYTHNSTSKTDQTIASLLCFAFVILWHGGRQEILIWAVLNYIEIVLEKIGFAMRKLELFSIYLNPQSMRRIAALLSVPLLTISCVSHYFFFGTSETAQHHLKRIINEPYMTSIFVLFIAYCGCQVSIETKMKEEELQKKQE